MLKKISFGVLILFFALVSVSALAQLTNAMTLIDAQGEFGLSNTVPTRTPDAGTIPTRTPDAGTIPTRTPGPGTIPTRTPAPLPTIIPDAVAFIQLSHILDLGVGDLPLEIRINGILLTTIVYGETTFYLEVPAGTYLLQIDQISVRGSDAASDISIEQIVTFDTDESYSVVVSGDGGVTQPAGLNVFADDNAAPPVGKAKVRVGHFAPFNSDVADTQVDVREKSSGAIVGGLDDIQYGTLSAYFELNADTEYDLVVTNADGTINVLDLEPVTFTEGEIATIIVSGGGANRDLGVSINSNIRKSFLPQIFVRS
ncbi:MAG: DUF4397 domain-containing protein [Anaerolineae bacterium]